MHSGLKLGRSRTGRFVRPTLSRKVLGERSSLVCVRVEWGFWQKSGILALEYAGMLRGQADRTGLTERTLGLSVCVTSQN